MQYMNILIFIFKLDGVITSFRNVISIAVIYIKILLQIQNYVIFIMFFETKFHKSILLVYNIIYDLYKLSNNVTELFHYYIKIICTHL